MSKSEKATTVADAPKVRDINSILKNKKVIVKPIVRERGNYPQGHDGEFRFTGAVWSSCLMKDRNSGYLVAIFSDEDRVIIEKFLNLAPGTMNFYDKSSPYWAKFRVKLDKDSRVLDLSKIQDYIAYKILEIDPRIAPSWNDRNENPLFEYALCDEEIEIKQSKSSTDKKLKAFLLLGKISEDKTRMQKVLRLTGHVTKTSSYKEDFLLAKLGDILTTDQGVDNFITIMEDKHFDTKILIEQGLECRALERQIKGEIGITGGDMIGRNIQEAIEYLETPKNQDIYLRIKAQVEEFVSRI